jgi:plasmid maintenance system antidote protein VapI
MTNGFAPVDDFTSAGLLRHELEAAGMTQRELGRLVGRSHEQVSRWCAGKAPIPAYAWTVIRLSQQLSQVRATVGEAAIPPRRGRPRKVQ